MSHRLDRLIYAVLHLPWWAWVLGLVLPVVLAVGALRWHGALRWQAVQRDIAACGLETDPARWVARAPVVDEARQAELKRRLDGLGAWTNWTGGWNPRIPATRFEKDAQRESVRLLAEGAADMRAVETLLDQGPVVLSSLGWITRDGSRLRAMIPEELAMTYVPSLVGTRACATWWANQAVLAEDPAPALRRLEQWVAACEPGGILIDTMIGVAMGATRNETLLWLACHGRLPEEEARRWLAEPPHQLRWGAESLAGERMLFIGSWRNQPLFPRLSATMWRDGYSHLGLMPTLNHDVAWGCSEMAGDEARLRGLASVPTCPRPPFGGSSITAIALPNLDEAAVVYAEAQFSHRTRRIAGLLAVRYRRGEALPADREALADLLPAGQLDEMTVNSPALLYERLAPSRFRLGIAANARPPLIPAGRWNLSAQPRYGSTIGQPPATKAVEDCRWSYELDLDAILVPPPGAKTVPGLPGN